jgi:hypothetical protein
MSNFKSYSVNGGCVICWTGEEVQNVYRGLEDGWRVEAITNMAHGAVCVWLVRG